MNKRVNSKSGFPSIITIFSAPNYCDIYQNKAAMIQCTANELNVKLYTGVSHPYVLPNFVDAFGWSLPFISEKVAEILVAILNQVSDEEINDDNLLVNIFKKPKIKTKIFKRSQQIDQRPLNLQQKESMFLKNADLKLGTLSASQRVRRRSSDLDREKLANLERNGVKSFEDASNLDDLQYQIINSNEDNNDLFSRI